MTYHVIACRPVSDCCWLGAVSFYNFRADGHQHFWRITLSCAD